MRGCNSHYAVLTSAILLSALMTAILLIVDVECFYW